jgi:hypothetical protein
MMRYMIASLIILMTMVGFGSANYIDQSLATGNYGIYYKVNMDSSHVGVSLEDNGMQEAAVDSFVEYVIQVYYNYVRDVDPNYMGYLNIVGFEYVGGPSETFHMTGLAQDARVMPLSVFIDKVFDSDNYLPYNHGDEPYAPGGYSKVTIRTSYNGFDANGDWLSPNDLGTYKITRVITLGPKPYLDPQPEPPMGGILIDSVADGFNPGEAI